ncbi:hypothetical protein FHR71_005611 [Methylobacterium sp. RAS18]|nr:hypothetical protein [Methylobacterium sp. RAS18]
MNARPQVVDLMLRSTRQIAAHEALVAEATQCAKMFDNLGDKRSALFLRQIIAIRQAELVDLRGIIARLANILVKMPIESV